MGVDFLKRINKSFHRALDRGEVALRTPTLLRSSIACSTRSARANLTRGAQVSVGDRLLVRLIDGKMIAQRDNTDAVLEFPNPPQDYVDRLNLTGGVEIGEVKVLHPISEAVEVSLCDEESAN